MTFIAKNREAIAQVIIKPHWLDSFNLLKFYRKDVLFLTFLNAINFHFLLKRDIQISDLTFYAFLSVIPMNFIYTLNIWSDWWIDMVNRIDRKTRFEHLGRSLSLIHSVILFLLSVLLGASFYFRKGFDVILLLLVLGIMYSLPPFRLKKNRELSRVTTTLIHILPIISVGFLNPEFFDSRLMQAIPFLFYIYALIPLKDLTDLPGDVQYQCQNWLEVVSPERLVRRFRVMQCVLVLATVISPVSNLVKLSLAALSGVSVVTSFKIERSRLYQTILVMNVILSLSQFCIQLLVLPNRLWSHFQ